MIHEDHPPDMFQCRAYQKGVIQLQRRRVSVCPGDEVVFKRSTLHDNEWLLCINRDDRQIEVQVVGREVFPQVVKLARGVL